MNMSNTCFFSNVVNIRGNLVQSSTETCRYMYAIGFFLFRGIVFGSAVIKQYFRCLHFLKTLLDFNSFSRGEI